MKKSVILIIFFALSITLAAQISYWYTFSSSAGTYSTITGTSVPSAIGDDVISDPVNIGFTFNYGINSYTQVKISSNGYVTLGTSTGGTSTYYRDVATTYYCPVIAPLWDDTYLNGSAKYLLSGSAPNRIFTIQFTGVKWTYNASNSHNYQVKLYENRKIDIVYGSHTGTPSMDAFASIGINMLPGGSGNYYSIVPGSPATASNTNSYLVSTFPASGTIYTFSPFIGGALTGTVTTTGTPLADVTVSVTNTPLIQSTIANGTFNFPTVQAGIDTVTFRKIGYATQTLPAVIVANQTTTLNVALAALPLVNVSGTVFGYDAPTVGLAGVTISLVGDVTYQGTTNAQGQFIITGVYSGSPYTYTISKTGYQNSTGNITIGSTNYNMNTIILNEFSPPVTGIIAAQNLTHTAVNLSWTAPSFGREFFNQGYNDRSLSGYNIYRLPTGQETTPTNWTTLMTGVVNLTYIDNTWVSAAPGMYKFAVRATYTSGVVSEPEFSNEIDYISPTGTITLISPTNGSWINSTPYFSWSATGLTDVVEFALVVDGNYLVQVIPTYNSYYQTPESLALSSGWHTWTVRGLDIAGNWVQATQTWSINVDSTPPASFSLSTPIENAWIATPSPTFVWNASMDNGSGLAKYQIYMNNTLKKDNIAPTVTQWTAYSGDFSENGEAGMSNWIATGTWGLTTSNPHSGSYCIADSPYGDYANNDTSTLTLAQPIALPGEGNMTLSYWYRSDFWINNYDHTYLEISNDGTAWTQIADYKFTNRSSTWVQVSHNLNGYSSWPQMYIRFRMSTNASSVTDGFFFDDLILATSGADLTDGNYNWAVKAVDLVGNIQPSTDTRTFHIDTIAPHGSTTTFANLTPSNNSWSADSLTTFTWVPCVDDGIGLNRYELWIDGTNVSGSITESHYHLLQAQVLQNGSHNWYVKAYDGLGNVAITPSFTLRIDRIAPADFNLLTPTNGSYSTIPTPTFAWNATTDAGCGLGHYELWIDGLISTDNIPNTQTSSAPALALSEGTHNWKVFAVDILGNRKQSSAIWTTTIDLYPPSTPSLISPSNGETVPFSRPFFSWNKSTDPGTGVHHYSLYIDNVQVVPSYIPTDINAQIVTIQAPSPLVNGSHNWYVKAFDSAGGQSSSPIGNFIVSIDTTPPTSSIINPVANQYIGGESYTITGSASDNTGGTGVQRVEISFDGGNTWFDTTQNSRTGTQAGSYSINSSNNSKSSNQVQDSKPMNSFGSSRRSSRRDNFRDVYNWQFNWSGYQTGSVTIKTRATDFNNNVESPLNSVPVYVEKILPVIQNITVTPNYATAGTVTFSIAFQTGAHCGGMNNSVTPTVTITPSGGTARPITQTNYQGNNWTGQTTIAQSDLNGTAVIRISNAKDNINNIMLLDATHTFVIDTQAPNAFNIVSPVDNAWINITQPQLTWGAATDATSGIDHYALEIDGSTNSPGNNNILATATTIQPSTPLSLGIHTWRIKAVDRAGNSTWSTSTFSLRVDLSPPVSAITSPTNNSTIGGITYTVTGTSSDGTGPGSSGISTNGVQIRINSGSWLSVVNTGTNFSTWTYSWTGYASGTYTIQSRATDNATNVETSPLTTTVTVNLNPPTVQTITIAPNPAKVGVVTCTAVFTANSAGLNYAVHPTLWFTTPNANIVNFTETSYSGNQWVGTASIASTAQNGTATVHVTGVTDNYNNTMAPNQNAGTFVIDTVSPTVSSIVVNPQITNIRTDLSVTVNFTEVTAGLNSAVSPVVTIIPLGAGVSGYISVTQTGYNVTTRTWTGVATINAQSLEGLAAVKVASATDLAGNVMQMVTLQNQFTIDRSAPTAFNILQPLEGSWTSNRQPLVSWSPSSDAISGLSYYKLYINDNQVGNNILPTITSATLQTSLPDGGYSVRVAAYDNAQAANIQLSGTSSTLFHVDGTAPISVITSPANGFVVQGDSVSVMGTAIDGVGANAGIGVRYVLLSKDGGANWDSVYVATTQTQGNVNWNHTYTNLIPGNHTIAVKSIDWLGNMELSTSSISISVQAIAPVANFSATPTNGVAPLSVVFADLSITGSWPITSWQWDFNNDGTIDSSVQTPTHVFARGTYTVSLTVRDAYNTSNTITITNMITATNQAPHVIQPMPDLSVDEDFTPIVISLSNYFGDNDGDNLVYSVVYDSTEVDAVISNSTLTINSVLNFNGSSTLTITADDQFRPIVLAHRSKSNTRATCSDLFILTINPINDAPVINLPDSLTFAEDGTLVVNLAPYVSDVDNATLTLTIISPGSSHIAVAMNNLIANLSSLIPNWNGTESVSFTVSDGTLSAIGQTNVIVTPVNDTPTLDLPPSFTFAEDGTLPINMAPYANDVDNTNLTLTASGIVNVTVAITGLNVTFGNVLNWNGTEHVTFTVNDNMGRAIASDSTLIIVTPVNDVPVITSFSPADTTLTLQQNDIQLFSVVADDVDSVISYSWLIDGVSQNDSLNTFEHQFTESNTYEVKVEVTDGLLTIEKIWMVTVPVGNNDQVTTPLVTKLYPNYPNPFNPETNIRFSVKNSGWVKVSVLNTRGQLVRNLQNGVLKSGLHTIVWNGLNNNGKKLSSGIYYIRMESDKGVEIHKATLMK